jgi:hypothetical protein
MSARISCINQDHENVVIYTQRHGKHTTITWSYQYESFVRP